MLKAVQTAPAVAEEEHPGLAEANKAADAAVSKYRGLLERITLADAQMNDGMRRRKALVAQAAEGKDVPAQQTFELETTIRSAEATAALLRDALPTVQEEVEEAERKVVAIVRGTFSRRIDAAEERSRKALEAERAASEERAAAATHLQNMKTWRQIDERSLLRDQSPEADSRRDAFARMKGH